MTIEGAAIWAALYLLALVAVYMVVERCLMCFQHRAAEPTEFERWLRQLAKGPISLSRMRDCGLGWLGRAFPADGKDGHEFRAGCHRIRQDVERFDTFLPMIPNAAQMLGLLGTAAGLAKCKLGVADPYSTIGLAIETTKCGLMIAIPMVIVIALLSKRNQVVLDQIEMVLNSLDEEDDGSPRSNGSPRPSQSSGHSTNGPATPTVTPDRQHAMPHDISRVPTMVRGRSNNHPVTVADNNGRGFPVVASADDKVEQAVDEVLPDGGAKEEGYGHDAMNAHHGNGHPK